MREKTMRIFLRSVKFVAKLLKYDIFCYAEENRTGYYETGYVAYSNSGSKVILKFVDEAATIQAE